MNYSIEDESLAVSEDYEVESGAGRKAIDRENSDLTPTTSLGSFPLLDGSLA